MVCLEESTVAALVSGELSEAERWRIDGHVDRCGDCRRLIAALVRGQVATPGAGAPSRTLSLVGDTAPPHVSLGPGERVSRYEIERFLGAGAMGAVYRARDPELGRRVALKLTDAAARVRTRRLVREAQAMARLSHPNIVPIYDAGESGGLMFIAMKEIEGQSLRQRLADRGVPMAERLRWLGDAARGLAAAHEAGIVHRDLKPDNILIDADGTALVGDFGLALVRGELPAGEGAEAGGRGGAFATATGTLLGTPAYMAPEVEGGAAADARSDQYSFAVTAAEVLGASGRELGAARMPRRLRRALRRALAVDPAERLASMAELEVALRPRRAVRRAALGLAIAAGGAALFWVAAPASSERDPVVACRQAAAERIGAVWNDDVRQRVADRLVAGAPSGAAALGMASLDRLDAYAASWRDMRRDACEATRARGEQSVALLDLRMACLDERLAELGAVQRTLATLAASELIAAGELTGLVGDLEQCADVETLAGRAPLDAAQAAIAGVLRGRLTEANATILRDRIARWTSSGAVESGDALAEVDAVIAEARGARLPALEADALRVRSHLLGKGEGPGDVDDLLASLAIGDRLGDPAVRADALIALLDDASREAARASEVTLLARLAGAAVAELPAPQRLRRARIDGNLGVHLMRQGKPDEAAARFEQVVAAYDDERGRENPYTMNARKLLASAYARAGRIDDAIAVYETMLSVLRTSLGPEHPYLVVVLLIEADNLGAAGRLDDASAVLERALALAKAVHGDQHPQVAKVWRTMGYVELDRDPRAALDRFGRARAIVEAAPGHPELGSVLIGLGIAQLETGDAAAAVETLERGMAQTGRAAIGAHLVPTARFSLARALWQSGGDRQRARELAHGARDQYQGVGPWPDDSASQVEAWLEEHR